MTASRDALGISKSESDHRGQVRTPRAWHLYTRAIAALVLPTGLGLFATSVYGSVVWERLTEGSSGKLVAVALAISILVLEARFLSTLIGLLRAGGRVTVYLDRFERSKSDASRRRRRLGYGAMAVSTGVSFLVCEGLFRLLDIRPPPPPPSKADDWSAVDNTLNAMGIRESWNTPPEDGRLRIAFLGDSIVYGDNVPPQFALGRVVEELLSPEVPRGVLSMNLGYRGTSPGRQCEYFERLKDILRPDIVVHVVYPNDLGIDMHRRLDEIYRLRDDDLWVTNRSYVLRYAERQVRYWYAWKRTVEYFRGGRDSNEREAAWTKFKSDVRTCRRTAEDSGARYALVLFPWLVRLDDYALQDVHDTMREFASPLNVPYLDLLETFQGRDAESLRVSLANEHPSALGHRLAAERIARFLREEVLPSVHP